MERGRRIIAALLTILLVIGMMPVVYAAEYCGDIGKECQYGPWKIVLPAKGCQDYGLKERTCKVCGDPSQDEYKGDHEYGSWQTTKKADCTQSGQQERKCKYCGDRQTKSLDKTGHSYGSWKTTKKASCAESGTKQRKCSVCGKKQTKSIDKTSHSYGSWKTVEEATCAVTGTKQRKCSVCGKKQTDTIGKKDHSYKWTTVEAATCIQKGKEQGKCRVCGKTTSRTTDYASHQYSEWKIIQEATDFSAEIRERVCSVCEKVQNEEFYPEGTLKRGGKNDKEEVKALQEGLNDAGYDCGTPDGDFGRNTENAVKKLQEANGMEPDGIAWPGIRQMVEHEFSEWTVKVEATPFSKGINERVCKKCGHSQEKEFYPEGTLIRGEANDKEAVKTMQNGLNEAGHDCGYVDGDFGPGTERAVKSFQEANGMEPDGIGWPGVQDMLAGVGDGEEPAAEDGVVFTKMVEGAPANGEFYVEGELVNFVLRVENLSGAVIHDVEFYDVMHGGNEDAMINYVPELEAGASSDGIFAYTITAEDAAAGSIENIGMINWSWDDNAVHSAESSVTILTGVAEEGEVTISKDISNDPIEHFYTPGEQIGYTITVINETNCDITDVEIYDPLHGTNEDAMVDFVEILKAGESYTCEFFYPVTEEVAAQKYVYNTATARYMNPETKETKEIQSNTTITLVGIREPEVDDGKVMLTKSVTTKPANGEYYVPGEQIGYELTVANERKTAIIETEIVDLLKGEDMIVAAPASVEAGETYTCGFFYTVTEADAEKGVVINSAMLNYMESDTDSVQEVQSNTVETPAGMPADPMDPVQSLEPDSPAEPKEPEKPAATDKPETPVATDEPESPVPTEKPETSAEPVEPEKPAAPVVPGEMVIGNLAVSKDIGNSPENGMFYEPGETVVFTIRVQNTGDVKLSGVAVNDQKMAENGGVKLYASMEPGAMEAFTFDYVVTEMDAVAGSITNIASAQGFAEDGTRYAAVSNAVTVPTGNGPFGVITSLDITKEETSAPANGTYYTEGETISYKITYVNTGETKLGETVIYDTLADGYGEIASAEFLHPGESRYCTFSHTVTAADVATGYVVNAAIAEYDVAGYINSAMSNIVISDTDGNPDPVGTTDSGRDDSGKDNGGIFDGQTGIEFVGQVDWEKLDVDPIDTCYHKLLERDDAALDYESHFCTKHVEIQKAIQTMLATADNENKQRMVWEYAYALWQKEIDSIYEVILEACDDIAKINVISERVRFLSMVANTQLALKIANPEQGAETARTIAKIWQDKCMDLCYEINTVPAERMDSFLTVEKTKGGETGEICTCKVEKEEKETILYTDALCSVHGFTYELMNALLKNEVSEETWETIYALWDLELNTAYNAIYELASDEGGMAYLAEYATYTAWLPARLDELKLFYQQNEIPAEVMVYTIMARALDICERIPQA